MANKDYNWKAIDEAKNRWDDVKYRIWISVGANPKKGIPCDDLTRTHVERALSSIGRNGYRATRAIEMLELYCPLVLVNEAVEKAAIVRKLENTKLPTKTTK